MSGDTVETGYTGLLSSVSRHPLPQWYDDAKFGIFIHWSPSCIPAYAPVRDDMATLLAQQGEQAMFANTPYAEWYLNSLAIPGSAVAKHHAETWGSDYAYDNFGTAFNEAIKAWRPAAWAQLFQRACARYVVLVTKHHDGFTLFRSDHPHPLKSGWQASRDVVAELTPEVRARGMKMGFYYSGLIDWSFHHAPITDFLSLATSGCPDQAYADYVDAHYRELIDRYRPDVLWNDIGYPRRSDVFALFADYYNAVPEGVVNDRWLQTPGWLAAMIGWPPTRRLLRWSLDRGRGGEGIQPPTPPHSDFATPEYTVRKQIATRKWECVRGIGKSFGYNAEEQAEDYLGEAELIHLLIDIVSKNGNLLLNVGPRPDGSIPGIQVRRLEALGRWLQVNGDAIFATRPWVVAAAVSRCGLDVRFTCRHAELFVLILGRPGSETVEIPLPPSARSRLGQPRAARLLGSPGPAQLLPGGILSIRADWQDSHAQALVLSR